MNEKAKCKNCTDEMIEEMAKDLEMVEKEAYSKIAKETQLYVKENHRYNSKEDYSLAHTKTIYELVAEALYNAGYRKIPEGSVVLSKEELNDLEYKAYSRGVCFACEKVDEQKEKVRKKTAKEFVERLKESLDISVIGYSTNEVISNVEDTIDNVAKQFGVEVEE